MPFNYLSLELNEARINWFNAASNYNDVVTVAADEAGGQGFVTEFAGASTALAKVVWGDADEQNWQRFSGMIFSSFDQLFQTSFSQYGQWDGFWDAVQRTVTLPQGVAFADFKICPTCYPGIRLPPAAYLAALESDVIAPIRDVQVLLDRHAYVTRLYSTLSAAEMTKDPAFTFNPGLEDVSNVHRAERVIECNSSVTQFQAPWRIELPQGGVIRGTGANAQSRTWPEPGEQPANARILQLASKGQGMVLEDNHEKITMLLEAYNAGVLAPSNSSLGGRMAEGGRVGTGGARAAGDSSADAGAGGTMITEKKSSGGCTLFRTRGLDAKSPWVLAGILAGACVLRRRRSERLRGAVGV